MISKSKNKQIKHVRCFRKCISIWLRNNHEGYQIKYELKMRGEHIKYPLYGVHEQKQKLFNKYGAYTETPTNSQTTITTAAAKKRLSQFYATSLYF